LLAHGDGELPDRPQLSHPAGRQNLFDCQHKLARALLSIMNPQVQIETATQLAVFLGNRPGALARVCAELAAAEINIHALATSDTIDHAVVRMVVSDPTKALMILGERGVLALENDVLMIESNNEPGTLATIAERLAKASINIEYAYLASTTKSPTGLMILRPSNVEKALRALHDL
jgi:hypothetical protein